jgi:hypothetical protein
MQHMFIPYTRFTHQAMCLPRANLSATVNAGHGQSARVEHFIKAPGVLGDHVQHV